MRFNPDAKLYLRNIYPLEIRVLACLHYLATGNAFIFLEEASSIHECTLRLFFVQFIEWMSELVRDKVKIPELGEEVNHVLDGYASLGIPGCVGSIDVYTFIGTSVQLEPTTDA
jgi:hypothetical protein